MIVGWKWEKPKQIELGWNKASKCYELRACYKCENVKQIELGEISGCDLGEIHPMVFTDGVDTDIFNGRLLRSKRQYQNKLKAKLSNLIDTKKARAKLEVASSDALAHPRLRSKRRKKLIKSKQKQLAKIKNQIKDIEHKLTSKAVSMLQEKSIQTLVIGDV
ncbi:MAG TPA: hypothetical protein V6C71_27015 [Coleofasciculaceae cyanobacterium]